MARVLLKARPTEAQLADRLAMPLPEGLELYLDTDDLADQAAMESVVERLARYQLPADFVLIVEGPIRSLDGEFFHVGRGSEADLEVVRRLVWLSQRIGAKAINLHAIAPEGPQSLTAERRLELLERSLPFLDQFASLTQTGGLVPTVENMPSVLRMRQGGFFFSAIGMLPEDLLYLVERIPGLRLCLDVSHAQLVVNAQRAAPDRLSAGGRLRDGGVGFDRLGVSSGEATDFPELYAFLRQSPPLGEVQDMLRRVGPAVVTAHISNASGVTGEGLPYGEGDLDLDGLVRELDGCARYLVTETLEPDPNRAQFMREAQRRMRQALGAERAI